MSEKIRNLEDHNPTPPQPLAQIEPSPSIRTNPPLPERIVLSSVWSSLDRKAGAVIEFTARQLRVRASTWVIATVGVLLMLLLLATYAEAMVEGLEPVDDDGDSVDWDEDGYP